MSFSHSQIMDRFKKGETSGKGSHLYIEGDTMYSYGRHFPLLMRMPWGNLMNADKYSRSTSKHQSHASRIATVLIPFSVLRSTSINYRAMELVHQENARYDLINYKRSNPDTGKIEYISVLKYGTLTDEEKGRWQEVNERRPSAIVLKSNNKYYLSSMDGDNYFLSELPRQVETCKEAFDMLKPKEVNGEYLRQGEWFFIPITAFEFGTKIKIQKQFILLPRIGGTGHHTATECKLILEIPYVRGTVRHSRKDHRMLKLGKMWHMALESNHVQSWGADGRVD